MEHSSQEYWNGFLFQQPNRSLVFPLLTPVPVSTPRNRFKSCSSSSQKYQISWSSRGGSSCRGGISKSDGVWQQKPLSPGFHHGVSSFCLFILIPLHSSHLESIPKISHPWAHIYFPRIIFFLPLFLCLMTLASSFNLTSNYLCLLEAFHPSGVREVSSGRSRSESRGGRGGRGRGEAAIKDSDEKKTMVSLTSILNVLLCLIFFFFLFLSHSARNSELESLGLVQQTTSPS